MFSIKSTISRRELIFSKLTSDGFSIEIKGDIATSMYVYTYTDGNGVSDLFSELSVLNKPWSGEKTWESIENNFKISISCFITGKVLIEIYANINQGGDEELSLNMDFITEFGQLPTIANNANTFFNI